MNICFLHNSMNAGGAERTIAHLSDYVAEQGHSVTILTFSNTPSFYRLNSKVSHIPLSRKYKSRNIFHAIFHNIHSFIIYHKVFKRLKADIVICFGYEGMLLSWLARYGLKYKIVGSERNNPVKLNNDFWSKNRKGIARLCDGFLFQTDGVKKYFSKYTQRNSIVLPNSINVDDFKIYDKNDVIRKNICAVGRLEPQKRYEDLIQAMNIVTQKHPEVHLDIYGDGRLRTVLERQVSELSLQNNITFHGRCSSILEKYREHKIFVLSSEFEGMPNVLIEAMASGCACVSTNCDFGPSELIENGKNGFLVSVHDYKAMAEKICELLDNEYLCKKIARLVLSIRRTHNIDNIGKIFIKYIEAL